MDEPTTPRVVITSLTFSDESRISLSENNVVVIVGPNNAGKSASLRAIRDKLDSEAHRNPVLASLEITRIGDKETFHEWLTSCTLPQMGSRPDDPNLLGLGRTIRLRSALEFWQRSSHSLDALSRWFCHLLSADERLSISNPAGNIAITRDNPSHPVHYLLRDDKLETQLSAEFRKAFGLDLIVHRNAGSEVPIHVGTRPSPDIGDDRASLSYAKKLEELPTLHTQGDGMRSFAGVLLATSVGRESIMLIDEPEAFLHPPQARLLGRTLVQQKRQQRQLFIATHSSDILRGVLDAESPQVTVVRIQRDGDKNAVRQLDSKRIKALWGDPLLRYSNILDGLFHEGVIVCEGDADCRFYAAVLDAILAGRDDDAKRPDLMFTHCGGKARLPVVIRALREVEVPIKAVSDFDVLNNKETLKSIVVAFGADWTEIEPDWRLVKSAVDRIKPQLSTEDVKKEIDDILSSCTSPVFPPELKSKIDAILKKSSPWALAKKVGKAFVPSGDPSQACERLLTKLRVHGLFVVDVGEIEGYVKTEGNHGPKWVNAVLQRQLGTDPELESARKFVQELAEF